MDRSPEPSSWGNAGWRAMLERYDAMLEASELETRVDTLRVDNSDGRFDDAEEGDEQSMEGGSHHDRWMKLILICQHSSAPLRRQ